MHKQEKGVDEFSQFRFRICRPNVYSQHGSRFYSIRIHTGNVVGFIKHVYDNVVDNGLNIVENWWWLFLFCFLILRTKCAKMKYGAMATAVFYELNILHFIFIDLTKSVSISRDLFIPPETVLISLYSFCLINYGKLKCCMLFRVYFSFEKKNGFFSLSLITIENHTIELSAM